MKLVLITIILILFVSRAQYHVFWDDPMNSLSEWSDNYASILNNNTPNCEEGACALVCASKNYITHDSTSTIGYQSIILQYSITISALNKDDDFTFVQYSIKGNPFITIKTYKPEFNKYWNEIINLPQQCDDTSDLRIRFKCNGTDSQDGFYIDNVILKAPLYPLSATTTTSIDTSLSPSILPTPSPSVSSSPSVSPSISPSAVPSALPITSQPTESPISPSMSPSISPSISPSASSPTLLPTESPLLSSVTILPSISPKTSNIVTTVLKITETRIRSSTETPYFAQTVDSIQNNSIFTYILFCTLAAIMAFCIIPLCCFIIMRYKRKLSEFDCDVHENLTPIPHQNVPSVDLTLTSNTVNVSNIIKLQTAYISDIRNGNILDISPPPNNESMSIIKFTKLYETDTGFDGIEYVTNWLTVQVGLPQYINNFIENGFDSLDIIKEITDKQELNDIGINLKGHQMKIMSEIKKIMDFYGQTAGHPMKNLISENCANEETEENIQIQNDEELPAEHMGTFEVEEIVNRFSIVQNAPNMIEMNEIIINKECEGVLDRDDYNNFLPVKY